MSLIFLSILVLVLVACIVAIILYFASQKFSVAEDLQISSIENALPGINCGSCGYVTCKAFAEACVSAESLSGLSCPIGGQEVMFKVYDILGKEQITIQPTVAVVRCNGTCENREHVNKYNGPPSCAIASMTYSGETNCSYGCLSFGDCVSVCKFDAIHINSQSLLPEVDEEKCTSCGDCVNACPKSIIEIRKKGPNSHRIYVDCVNKDKAVEAESACKVACISCSKCEKACAFEAITIADNLAYINDDKCCLCRKCISVCPTGAIVEIGFSTIK